MVVSGQGVLVWVRLIGVGSVIISEAGSVGMGRS